MCCACMRACVDVCACCACMHVCAWTSVRVTDEGIFVAILSVLVDKTISYFLHMFQTALQS